jgi:hypothetical protein
MTISYPASRYRTKFVHAIVDKFDRTLSEALLELVSDGGIDIIGVRATWYADQIGKLPEVCTVIEYLLPEAVLKPNSARS